MKMKDEAKDEEYLLCRARKKEDSRGDRALKSTEISASSKAWLITSRLILPNNFNIQYEAYSIEKERNRPEDAAKTFTKLFQDFSESNEDKLWSEIDALIHILSSTCDESDSFLRQLFQALSSDVQRQVLLSASNHASEPLTKMKRLLLAFQQFPDLISSYGSSDKGIAFMLDLCKQKIYQRQHLDEVVTLFITEIAPLMVPAGSVSGLKIEASVLHEILLMAFEFIFISLLTSKDPLPWSTLLKLFAEIGTRLSWPISTNIKEYMEKGLTSRIYTDLCKIHASSPTSKEMGELNHDQVFYFGSLIFFKSLAEYLRIAQGLDGQDGGSGHGAILVEAFVTYETEECEPLAKKARRRPTEDEKKIPNVTHADLGKESPLVEAFTNCVNYYDLLASDQGILNRLQNQLRPPDSVIFPFFVDIAIYQARFREALTTLKHIHASTNLAQLSPSEQIRFHLKAAALCYATGDNQTMTDQVWNALTILGKDQALISDAKNPKEARIGKALTFASYRSRHIHFLECSRQGILAYAVKILFLGLKEKAVIQIAKNDMAIGHILTLLQYSYPEDEDFVLMILDRIKRADNFTYPVFFHHIIHVEFLEMFSNVMSESKVTLDIAATYTGAPAASSTTSGSRRLGTRGANRGEKNEIRNALKKQMTRCYENMDDIILDFVQKNRDSLFQCML